MTDRSVTVRLKAVTSEYTAAMSRAGQATTSFGKDAAKHTGNVSRELQGVSSQATIVGASLLGIGVAAVATFASFDKQMSGVQAVTAATAEEMDKLRAAAIQAGQATQYSASDAAGAETELAKAGVSTADILGGALSGSLALAAAGQLDVASSASIAATAMTQFGLKGTDVGHIADLLAAGANKAQGSVQDLGTALKYVGPVAHQMNIPIDETVGVLAELASNGILADQAGTSLRGMLTALTSPSKQAAKTMHDLGINVYDAQGNFVGFTGVAGQLQDKLGHLTNAQRDQALGMIFGNEQITAARVLYAGGAQAVQDWTSKVNDQGTAARQAGIQMDNLSGDLNNLQSSLETTLIQSGSQANGVLRDMVQAATGAVNFVGQLPGPILAIGTAVTVASGGFLIAAPRIVAVNEALAASPALARTASRAFAVLGPATAALAALTVALDIKNNLDQLDQLESDLNKLYATLGQHVDTSSISDLKTKIEDLQSTVADPGVIRYFRSGLEMLVGMPGEINRSADDLAKAKAKYATFQEVVGNVAWALGTTGTRAMDLFMSSGVALTDNVDATANAVIAYAKAQHTGTAASHTAAAAMNTLADSTASAADTLKAYETLIDQVLGVQLDAKQRALQWKDAIAELTKTVKDNGRTLDENTAKGRANAEALLDRVRTALDGARADLDAGAALDVVQRKYGDQIKTLEQAAIKAGLNKDAVHKLLDAYLKLPSSVTTKVTADTTQATAAISALEKRLRAMARSVNLTITATGDVNAHGTAGHAAGGWITGPGTATSDSVLTPTSRGEFVLQAAAAQAQPRAAEAFNAGDYARAAAYLGGAPSTTFTVGQITAVAAPGERAAESIPRALRNKVYELTGAGG